MMAGMLPAVTKSALGCCLQEIGQNPSRAGYAAVAKPEPGSKGPGDR